MGTKGLRVLCSYDKGDSWTQLADTAGKHVFVEKPLALDRDQLLRLKEGVKAHPEQVILASWD